MPSGIYKRKPFTKEHRKKMSLAKKEHKVSKKTKEKIRKAQKNKPRFYLRKERHYLWKGDKAGYVPIHMWIKRRYGKANKCENIKCFYPRMGKKYWMEKPKRYEWALLKGKKYSHERENYIMLCTSCHGLYDKSNLKIKIVNKK